jgi:hypothetical protein
MSTGLVIAVIVVLVIIAAAAVYLLRRPCPPPAPPRPPCPAVVRRWVISDNPTADMTVLCPPGERIAVQDAAYGAPWYGCAWNDVTSHVASLMDGRTAYTIPAGTNLGLGIGGLPADPCVGVLKTLSATYTCT